MSLYPLALALFLLCLHAAAQKQEWSWRDAASLAATLALLTYTYSIGRLLAPLLAFGLLMFVRRAGWRSVLSVWTLYALALAPLVVFGLRHPGALTARFSLITYLTPQSTIADAALGFLRHYAANVSPWRLVVAGDPNYDQMAHLLGAELMLAATALLSAVGAWILLRRGRPGAWWGFVLYGLAVSIVPASLTDEPFHMLHLAPVPVFLILLTMPALGWLCDGTARRRRALLIVFAAATLAQGASFQWRYAASATSTRRLHLFDAAYERDILMPALNAGSRPVYLSDAPAIPGSIQAYWHATLQGVPVSTFVRLRVEDEAPPGAPVITTKDACARCRVIAQNPPYTVYIAGP